MNLLQLLLVAVVFAGSAAKAEELSANPSWVIVEVEDLLGVDPHSPLYVTFGAIQGYALHNGDFKAATIGQQASAGLASFAARGDVSAMFDEIVAADPGAIYDHFVVGSSARLSTTNAIWDRHPPIVEPSRHRFLTYFFRICPSDDAVIVNTVPIRLFDDDGSFVGPLVIDLYADDVLDAGVRENREHDLLCQVDWNTAFDAPGVATSEPVHVHPGFNGSVGNPDGPVGILGASGSYLNEIGHRRQFSYQPEITDFTRYPRGSAPFARIRVTAGAHGALGGNFFDPARNGEGVTLDISGEWKERVASVTW